jgi:Luciferase
MAGVLNHALEDWERVRITPMFGRWSYFVAGELFGCYPMRLKDHDLWVRLSDADQARALASAGVRPHRRFGGRGWIECDLVEPGDLPLALKWLRRGHGHLLRSRPPVG